MLLGVNIDHVATLRQARGGNMPSISEAARVAELAGADAITVHLREDRRHIQDQDVILLQQQIKTRVNLEMAVTGEMLDFAEQLKPADVCLVPEKRQELTTEGGLDVVAGLDAVSAAVNRLTAAGVRVSLFIDPDPVQLQAARDSGAPVVELHTGLYAEAEDDQTLARELERIQTACQLGESHGLHINAGHGLNYENVQAVAAIPVIQELNIGHAIISKAVFTGLEAAVRDMKALIEQAVAGT